MKSIDAKVVLLGDQGVGKTSISVRYFNKKDPGKVASTIGASFFSKKINIEDYKVTLHIWDTAGHERFKAMAPMFYRNANAAVLVFDITYGESFQEIKYWVNELGKNVEEKIVICLVGNKLDLALKREISYEDARKYATSIGASYFETSAVTNEALGVEQLFNELALDAIKLFQEKALNKLQDSAREQITTVGRKAHDTDEEKPAWCC